MLMLCAVKKMISENGFLIISFPTAFFQAPVLIFQLMKKKGNKKVVFTGY